MVIKRQNTLKRYSLNASSLKMKEYDLEFHELPNQKEEIFTIYEEEKAIAEIKMLFYFDKAFAVLTGLKTFEAEKKKKKILKNFLSYLFHNSDLPYPILEVKCEQLGSGFSSDTLELVGFIKNEENSDIYVILNPAYMELIMEEQIDQKPFIEEYLYFQRRNKMKLNEWNQQLRNLFRETMNKETKGDMIQNKKTEMKLLAKKIKQYSLFTNYDIRYLEEFISMNENKNPRRL